MAKSDRVSLRADDAITAFMALRERIERYDDRLADPLLATRPVYEEMRAEDWEVYQRIAKALGLKPTLSTKGEQP